MSLSSDPKLEYDMKKKFLDELKNLDKAEYEEMFRIIKTNEVSYSENSNGIFFDLNTLSTGIFQKLQECISRNKKTKNLEQERAATIEAMIAINKA